MDQKYWVSNEEKANEPEEPDNFLMGELLSARQSKRRVTADHVAISYWKQEEISAPQEAASIVEEFIPPRAQYAERVLRGLVSGESEFDELNSEPALDLDAFTSILAVSAKQKFVDHTFLNHVLEREGLDEYYDEENDGDTWSPNTVQAA